MANVSLRPSDRMSTFRKIAVGSWQTAYDPSVYGHVTVRMEKALEYVAAFREAHGVKVTVTQLVAKAVAEALRQCPEANAMLRWNRIYFRNSVDLCLQVAMEAEEGADLSMVKVDGADRLTLLELTRVMEQKVARVRARQDEHLEATRATMAKIPPILMNAVLKIVAFLTYTLNLDLSWAGVPRDAFGSAFITSVGTLGLEAAYVPLLPYSRVPIFVAPGAVQDVPVVDGDRVVPGKLMILAATFDHRFIDGMQASMLARTVKAHLEDPFAHYDAL